MLEHPGVALESQSGAEGSPNDPTTSPVAALADPGMDSGRLVALANWPAAKEPMPTLSARPWPFAGVLRHDRL